MTPALSLLGRAIRLSGALLPLLLLALSACGRGDPSVLSENPLVPGDSVAPPADSVPPPGDSTLPPPAAPPTPDSTVPPPPDSAAPPAGPVRPPAPPPVHVGIPFGPFHLPPALYGPEFTGVYLAALPESLLANLEAARWANARVLLNFTGHNKWFRDSRGFNFEMWKKRVDRFRGLDLSSYIADGTIIGHFIMDEPNDSRDWNGTVVSRASVDAMAEYSKQIWPSMTTIIRAWPAYLKGYQYRYLDAAWAQFNGRRFPNLEAFIAENVGDAKASGLELVVGLNVLAGGIKGPLGYYRDRNAMSPSELRSWGGALLSEPYICAVMNWRYDREYFSRPDIVLAFEDLNQQARNRPQKSCAK